MSLTVGFLPPIELRRVLLCCVVEISYCRQEQKRRNCRAVGLYMLSRSIPSSSLAVFRERYGLRYARAA